MNLKRPIAWMLGIGLLWTLFHNGVLMVIGTSGVTRYAREGFMILLSIAGALFAVRALPRVRRQEAVMILVVLATFGVASILLFKPNEILTFSERLKGWYGFCVPFGLAMLLVLLQTGRREVERLMPVLLGVGLVFALGILADSLFGLRLNIDVFEDKGAKFAHGAYRASFIIDSPMGAGYLTASVVLLAVYALWKGIGGWRMRSLAVLTLAAGTTANLTCLSRGGTIILIGSLGLMWMLTGSFRVRPVLAGAAVIALFITSIQLNDDARRWLSLTLNFENETSNVSRESSWLDGFEAAKESGMTGFGLGITRDAGVRSTLDLVNGENTLLHGWLEGGTLLGGCLAAWLVLWLGITALGSLRALRTREPYLGALCAINLMTWVYSFAFPILVERTVSVLALCWFGLLVHALAAQVEPVTETSPELMGVVPCES